jgi:hypothetical protein
MVPTPDALAAPGAKHEARELVRSQPSDFMDSTDSVCLQPVDGVAPLRPYARIHHSRIHH